MFCSRRQRCGWRILLEWDYGSVRGWCGNICLAAQLTQEPSHLGIRTSFQSETSLCEVTNCRPGLVGTSSKIKFHNSRPSMESATFNINMHSPLMLSTSSSINPSPVVASIPSMRRRLLCPGMIWSEGEVIKYAANPRNWPGRPEKCVFFLVPECNPDHQDDMRFLDSGVPRGSRV